MAGSKRANGEGSIRKKTIQGKIYWEGRYTDKDGKQRSVSGKTQTEVRDKIRRKLSEIEKLIDSELDSEQGIFTLNGGKTFDEYYNVFKSVRLKKLKPQTLCNKEWQYKKHFKPLIGNIPMQDINPLLLQKIANMMAEKNFTRTTIKNTFSVISPVFRYAFEEGHIIKNPVLRVDFGVGTEPKSKRGLTDSEIKTILKVTNEKFSYLYPLFVFLVNTGVRLGEAMVLKWEDFNKDYSWCTITKTFTQYKDIETQEYKKEECSPKNTTSERGIPINADLSELLKKLKKDQISKGIYKKKEYVFLSKNGKPLIRSNVEKNMKKINSMIVKKYDAKFPDVTPHYFRHTFASRAIENNVPQIYIQKLCGWADSTMLSKIYGHMNEMQAQKAIGMIPAIK